MVGSQKSTFKYLHMQSKHSQSNIIDKFDLFHNRSCISAKINADEMDINFKWSWRNKIVKLSKAGKQSEWNE